MSIIFNINNRRQKLSSKKLMLHNFAVDSAIYGNFKFKFSESGEDYDINIQFDKFDRSNITEINMPVVCKVGQNILS